jgi:hypothetical protein
MGRKMKGCCTSLLVAVNTVTLAVGLAVLGLSIYLLVEKRTWAPSGADSWVLVAAAWAPFALGLVISVLALIGCCSAISHSRCCIGIFGLMQLLVGIVLIVAGTAWVVGSNYMFTVSTSGPAQLAPGFDGSQHALSDASSGLFYACCAGGALPANLRPCVDATREDISHFSLSSVCYWNLDTFSAPIVSAQKSQDMCKDLVKGGLFTCPPASAGTSGLAVRQLQASMASYTHTHFWPTGIALIVAGAILLLAFMGSMYLACCAATKVQQPKHKSGANMAGGPADATKAQAAMV